MTNVPTIDACCPQMTNLLSNAGMQGFSIIVVPEDESFGFRVQFRSLNADIESSVFQVVAQAISALPEAERKSTAPMRVSGQYALQFCPGCGCRLSKWGKKRVAILSELAEEHHAYNME